MTERGQRKERVGTVVSDKMNKTVVVSVARHYIHATYGRIIRDTAKYVAHDEKDECRIGDRVKIVETRPLSKTKRWRVTTIVERAK
jgi:small subunit ribosomal protein S17